MRRKSDRLQQQFVVCFGGNSDDLRTVRYDRTQKDGKPTLASARLKLNCIPGSPSFDG
jgi:hypothetical protein